jgi:hypothetical protein
MALRRKQMKKITINDLIRREGRRLGGDYRLTLRDMMGFTDLQLLAMIAKGK